MRGRRKTGLGESIPVVVAKEGDGGERRRCLCHHVLVTHCQRLLHESVPFWLLHVAGKTEDQ